MSQTADLQREVTDLIYREATLLDRRRWDDWIDLYTEDAVSAPMGAPTRAGRAAIQASCEAMFAEMTFSTDIRPSATNVSGDWGFDTGEFTGTATPKAGSNTGSIFSRADRRLLDQVSFTGIRRPLGNRGASSDCCAGPYCHVAFAKSRSSKRQPSEIGRAHV